MLGEAIEFWHRYKPIQYLGFFYLPFFPFISVSVLLSTELFPDQILKLQFELDEDQTHTLLVSMLLSVEIGGGGSRDITYLSVLLLPYSYL